MNYLKDVLVVLVALVIYDMLVKNLIQPKKA